MTTAQIRATDVLVVDMSTMRFQWNADNTACAAMTARGEVVAVIDADAAEDERVVAFRALDAALDRGQVLRSHPEDPARRVSYRLALYNPFSAEVSVGCIPATVTFTDSEPVELPVDGVPATAVVGGRAQRLALDSGRVLAPRTMTFAAATRAQLAHQSLN